MGRAPISRVEPPRGRSAVDIMFFLGIAVVLVFAAAGVIGAGSFVADRFSRHSATATPVATTVSNVLALQSAQRARLQATAIIREARSSARSIVSAARALANRRARTIVSRARATATAGVSTPTAFAAPVQTGPSSVLTPAVPVSTPPPETIPNLGNVPASWLVVGFGASFGNGPGTVGGISVINRGRSPLSGAVHIKYRGSSGSATAAFQSLATGEVRLLPLNGRAYPGGGYQIMLVNVH